MFQGKKGKTQVHFDDSDIKAFLATSSEEEEEDGQVEDNRTTIIDDDTASCMGENERIVKYRNLLSSLTKAEEAEKSKRGEMEMEITWGVGLKEKAEQLVKKKMAEKTMETTWEQHLAARREKRKARKMEKKKEEMEDEEQEDDDDIPSDIDMNDPYFQEEFKGKEFIKPGKKKGKDAKESKNDMDNDAELDLLLMDENVDKRHFNFKSIVKNEQKIQKKSKDKIAPSETDFKVCVYFFQMFIFSTFYG